MMKYRIGMIVAVFAFIAILPLRTEAAESTMQVTYNETEAAVKVTLPNAAQEKITTLSLSLKLEPDSTENVIPEVAFSPSLEGVKVKEYRYNESSLNIYIAGTEPLFTAGDNGDILEIGTVSLAKESTGEKVGFKVLVDESILQAVRGGASAEIQVSEASEDPDGPDGPGTSDPADPGTSDPAGPSETEPSEIAKAREDLRNMIEKAERIPKSDRTADLQSAIDKARLVLDDPNASLEDLKAALLELENADALYESAINSGNNNSDSGEEKQKENQRQNGSVTQAVKTGDENSVAATIAALILAAAVSGANVCRRQKKYR